MNTQYHGAGPWRPDRLVAVDWGTSSLRGALLDRDGKVLQERSFARGILTVEPGGFPAAFAECFGDWMQEQGTLCLMAGMVGSRQGWQEAPYCPCPAGFAQVVASLSWLEPGRIAIVPGLCCEHAGVPHDPVLGSVPDVMRGEETQILGAMRLLGLQDGIVVLPGTHSKWVTVQDGLIRSFSTFMTGEFYALLKQHSILGRTMPAQDGMPDDAAFALGVQLALRSEGLLGTAFSARTLALFNRLQPAQLPDYLSGLVIGEELRSRKPDSRTPVVLVGSDGLTRRYQQALALQGISSTTVGMQASWAGLHAIADVLGQQS
jgi:2-dehydro-3-deoxygalactonokinase